MISGKLLNNTVWWLSKDGLKIWIESRDLEQERFIQKGYNIVHGRILHAMLDVGELATSRLDSRKGKNAWVIKSQAMLDVYPELIEEIQKKGIEEKKKKKTKTVPSKKDTISSADINRKEPKRESVGETIGETVKGSDTIEPKKSMDYFDINRPYITWLKDEIHKNGKIVITSKNLKEKMGEEFVGMHDIRIHFGLKKILSSIGITVECRSLKGESVVIMKKIL